MSILTIVGSGGMAAAIGGIGIGVATLETSASLMELAKTVVEYPFCYNRHNKTMMRT